MGIRYARADSAAALFERANRAHGWAHGLVNFAFYPAAYCLRHGLELFIKQMSIYLAYKAADPTMLYGRGHSLEEAWARIRDHVREHSDIVACSVGEWCDHDVPHLLDVIESLVQQLHELDPDGTILRYAEHVRGRGPERQVTPQPPPFDLVNLDDWAAMSSAALRAATVLLGVCADDLLRWALGRWWAGSKIPRRPLPGHEDAACPPRPVRTPALPRVRSRRGRPRRRRAVHLAGRRLARHAAAERR